MDKFVLKLAAKLNQKYLANYLEFVNEPTEYNEFGQRLARHYCEHGVSMWGDYDCACGSCEMGYTMGDGVQRMQAALAEAKRRMADFEALMVARETLRKHGFDGTLDMPEFSRKLGSLLVV